MDGAGLFSGSSRALWRRWRLDDPPGLWRKALVPVEITSTPASASPCAPPRPSSPPQRTKAGIIEIELGGCCVRVDRDVDAEALQR